MTTIGYGVSDPLLGRSGDSASAARKVVAEQKEQMQCKIKTVEESVGHL